MLCYVMLCYAMLCYVMLCYVMYVMLCCVMYGWGNWAPDAGGTAGRGAGGTRLGGL